MKGRWVLSQLVRAAAPMTEMTNQEVIDQWADAVDHIDDFGDEGDFARQHLLNPVIFALLGPVDGKRVLDAGCGQGYLSRLLAKQGAIVEPQLGPEWAQRGPEYERNVHVPNFIVVHASRE